MSSLSCGNMQLKCLRDACAVVFWDWSKDKKPSFTPGIFTEFQRILNKTDKSRSTNFAIYMNIHCSKLGYRSLSPSFAKH